MSMPQNPKREYFPNASCLRPHYFFHADFNCTKGELLENWEAQTLLVKANPPLLDTGCHSSQGQVIIAKRILSVCV